MADCLGALAQPAQGDAQVLVGRRVLVVVAQGGLVVHHRFIQVAGFEQQVADVDDCGHKPGIGLKRAQEIGRRVVAAVALHLRDAAFVERRRPGRIIAGRLQRGRKQPAGFLAAARFERAQAGGVRARQRTCIAPESKEPARVKHYGMAARALIIDLLTLFPEMFAPFIGLSIVGRAVESGLVDVRLHHLLETVPGRERVDDTAYGGGPGMVMRIEPLAHALDAILEGAPPGERREVVLTTPAGAALDHATAAGFAALDRLVVICGRYEGIDERLGTLYRIREVSLGDFVVTGGEIPALAILDATIRLIPGAIEAASLEAESFAAGGLDYPVYTRPARFRGIDVPEVLLSGDHKRIAEWRREQSRSRTAARRPDLAEE